MRRPLIAASLLGLLALVALGSRSGEWGSDDGPREISRTAVDYTVTIAVIFFVAMLIIAIVNIRALKGQVRVERLSGLRSLVIFLTIFTLLAYVGLNRVQLRPQEEEENDDVFGPPQQTDRESARQPADSYRPDLQWWLIAVAGVAGGVGVVLMRRRPRRERERDAALAEELTTVLSETLEDLEQYDPRRAVIRAYVRMEEVLAAHGFARAPHEAPHEYLARVLRELRVRPEAAHALTELFEVARFSTHEIDAEMKQEAIEALETVRDDLKAAA